VSVATEAERAVRAGTYENPRPDMQALVPRDARRILDLGSSSSALGAALKARHECEVVGVEMDPVYAEWARERPGRGGGRRRANDMGVRAPAAARGAGLPAQLARGSSRPCVTIAKRLPLASS
jgi:hypothetical protein